ncbi:MAG TPA: hypothetical protein VGT78_14900 [Rhizomicrobium sp.]|nr:hypothetical protein [Rhizomicrobium sp.]
MIGFEHITQWASLGASIATVLALVGLLVQIRSASKLQKRETANSLYAAFLQAAAVNSNILNAEPADDIPDGSPRDWMVYFWLTALESGWLAYRRDGVWERRIRSCVRQNLFFFENSPYWHGTSKYKGRSISMDFDPKFRSAIAAAVQKEAKS